jgi:hypothetical protein
MDITGFFWAIWIASCGVSLAALVSRFRRQSAKPNR